MLSHRKEDTEKRNEHLKHMVLVLVIVAILAAVPHIVFLIAGVDVATGCATDDASNCLSQDDDSVEGMLLGNANTGLLVYRFAIAFCGVIAMGYKGIAA